MKTREIVVGGTYSNGKGRVRKVTHCDARIMHYEILNDGTRQNRLRGVRGEMTVIAFARWAKERIS